MMFLAAALQLLAFGQPNPADAVLASALKSARGGSAADLKALIPEQHRQFVHYAAKHDIEEQNAENDRQRGQSARGDCLRQLRWHL